MAVRTTQQQLDAIDTLIATMEAEPMEEFSRADRRYRRARLADLYAERARLQERLDAESASQFRLAEVFTE